MKSIFPKDVNWLERYIKDVRQLQVLPLLKELKTVDSQGKVDAYERYQLYDKMSDAFARCLAAAYNIVDIGQELKDEATISRGKSLVKSLKATRITEDRLYADISALIDEQPYSI
jgi:hypothetical protein